MQLLKPTIEVITCVLDDDEDYLILLDKILKENAEHPYMLYSDIDTFMGALGTDKKICIIDQNLKARRNGIELMMEIKEKNPYSYIIMVSSQADIDIVTEFYDNDGFRYIPKHCPHFSKRLITAIERAKAAIQRHLDFHFEMIQKFNKTKETIDNARNTLSNNKSVGTVS